MVLPVAIGGDLDVTLGYSVSNLGKRVHGDDIPVAMRKFIERAEPAWNRCLTEDSDEAWEYWNHEI